MGIEVKRLTKRFKEVTALDGVDIDFGENRIYGLLGRNGAGKTTLLNVITNHLFPDGGEVLVDGEAARENDRAQGKIYCMSEKSYYPDGTKVADLFQWTGNFYPAYDGNYAAALCDKFGLRRAGKLKDLSTGYATICKLVLTLASGADYLLFDEPVLGLDANHRELFYRELLTRYSERPCTMVISTHLIEEVAGVIGQVVIIRKGKIMMDRPAEEVMRMGYTVSGKASDVDSYCREKNVLGSDTLGGLKTASLFGERDSVPPELEVSSLDLQKLFIRLTNEKEGE